MHGALPLIIGLLGSASAEIPDATGPEWTPSFVAENDQDGAIARIAWEAAVECTGRLGEAHPQVVVQRRTIPGGFLGLAHWDDEGLFRIDLDAKPERLEEVIVHEVAHAWVQRGPPTLVEGRTELLADCIVARRAGLASLQWDDGRELHRLPDLRRWSNPEDHGPALLADARTDAYLGAARLIRTAALLVDPSRMWTDAPMSWEDFRALLSEVDRGEQVLAVLDGGVDRQREALADLDLDGLPRLAEQILGSRDDAWDSDHDGWWDGEALGVPHMAVALPFDGSPVCTGLAAPPGAPTRVASGGNLRGEGRPVPRIRQTRPGAPLLVELTGSPNAVTGGIWAVVEGTHLISDDNCTDTHMGTVWAADPKFKTTIPDFVLALHEASSRADARWGPTTRRMGIALGAQRTQMDGAVVQISEQDLDQALASGHLEQLATLAVALHRVWDNGTRQWPVATAMARALATEAREEAAQQEAPPLPAVESAPIRPSERR